MALLRVSPNLIGKRAVLNTTSKYKDEGIIQKQSFIGTLWVRLVFLDKRLPPKWCKFEEIILLKPKIELVR